MSTKKKKLLIFLFVALVFFYYQMEYKRYFLSDKDGKEFITIWTSSRNDCYIIPGKYYSPFKPRNNYIKTVNHRNYIGLVWNTQDSRKLKISIYHGYELFGLDPKIQVFGDNDSLLLEYGIGKRLGSSGKRVLIDDSDKIKNAINYEYVDLNRIVGIKRFKW